MIFQNMVWFTWPPPLFRTAPRNVLRNRFRSRIRSSGFSTKFGCFSIAHSDSSRMRLVHIVMQFHRLRVDHRLEGRIVIGQGG